MKKMILVMLTITLCYAVAVCPTFIDAPQNTLAFDSADTSQPYGIPLPIVMYHSINKGNLGKYVLHPNDLERDIIWLKRQGYTFVNMRDTLSYLDGTNDGYPEKPVILTFDDGFYNNLEYALPILQKHNAKAVISVVGSFTEKEKGQRQSVYYSNLNACQLAILHNSGSFELANHTYDLHAIKNGRDGAKRKYGESLTAYRKALSEDLTKNQALIYHSTGYLPVTFSYPYGSYTDSATQILKDSGFRAAFTCNEGINYLGKTDIFALKRYNRPSGLSSDSFFRRIMKLW